MATALPGRSKPQVRANVLRAALEAVEEHGPDKVRVQDVARRAGMSSGHVMYYFGDRDRILADTLLLSEAQLTEKWARTARAAAGPWDAVDRFSRLYLPAGPRDVRWTLWAQMIARPPEDAATRSRLRDAVDSWTDALAALTSQGIAAGEFRGVDVSATARRYCRFLDGLALDVLLGVPGRRRTWAVDEAAATWRFLVG
jgi:AcrR family transcriptional regulator